MKKAILVLAAITFLVFGLSVIRDVNKSNQELHIRRIELNNNEHKLKQLETDFNQLNGANAENEQQIQELEQKRQQLEKEKSDLEAQLQAKAELKDRQAKAYAAAAPTVPFTQRGLSGNAAKDFIYQHESGNHPCKINGGAIDCNYTGSRACGLGQALPCSKLTSVCSLSDYDCQDRWFTGYMQSRYGTWEKAMAFWKANRWW